MIVSALTPSPISGEPYPTSVRILWTDVDQVTKLVITEFMSNLLHANFILFLYAAMPTIVMTYGTELVRLTRLPVVRDVKFARDAQKAFMAPSPSLVINQMQKCMNFFTRDNGNEKKEIKRRKQLTLKQALFLRGVMKIMSAIQLERMTIDITEELHAEITAYYNYKGMMLLKPATTISEQLEILPKLNLVPHHLTQENKRCHMRRQITSFKEDGSPVRSILKE